MKRPKIRVLISILVVVLLAVLSREVWWALTARPRPTVDYAAELNRSTVALQIDPALKPPANMWPTFERVIELARKTREELAAEAGEAPDFWPNDAAWPPDGALMLGPGELDPRVVERTREVLDRFERAGVGAGLDEAASGRLFARMLPEKTRLIDVMLPDLKHARELARLETARMRLSHLDGNDAGVVRAFERTLTIGRALAHQSTLIERLVAYAILDMSSKELRSQLQERPMNAAFLRAALDAMDRALPLPPISRAFEGERAFALDAIQWTHTDDGTGDGRFIPAASVAFVTGPTPPGSMAAAKRLANMTWFAFPTKAESIARANQFYDSLVRIDGKTRHEREALFSPDREAEKLRSDRFVTLSLVVPALERAFASDDEHRLHMDGLRVMLALELYRAAEGDYPPTLEALAPKHIPSVPRDRVSGRALSYFLADPSKDPYGRGYVLYSVGVDGVDNDGVAAADPVTPLRKPGVPPADYPLNTPR